VANSVGVLAQKQGVDHPAILEKGLPLA
jgi:hypothetical protein